MNLIFNKIVGIFQKNYNSDLERGIYLMILDDHFFIFLFFFWLMMIFSTMIFTSNKEFPERILILIWNRNFSKILINLSWFRQFSKGMVIFTRGREFFKRVRILNYTWMEKRKIMQNNSYSKQWIFYQNDNFEFEK